MARALTAAFVVPLLMIGLVAPAAAQAPTISDIAAEVDRTGRYVDFELTPEEITAVERANDEGIAFVWLNESTGSIESTAASLLDSLTSLQSGYSSVILIDNADYWVVSNTGDGATAAGAAANAFGRESIVGGLDAIVGVLAPGAATTATTRGTTAPTTNNAEDGATASADAANPTSSSGGGVPWLMILLLAGLAFLAFRFFSGRARTKKAAAVDLENDRREIQEQLKNNADRVITLGDRAIATRDPALARLYEEASAAFQDVSTSIAEASSPQEIDALDNKIDHAEWQFEVIEARLEGRPDPAKPTDDDPPPPAGSPTPPAPKQRPGMPPPPSHRSSRQRDAASDRPALADDESIFDRSRTQTRSRPRRTQTRSRRSGGMGGMGGLGSILGSILLGGAGRTMSRRSQRRSGGFGSTSSRSNSNRSGNGGFTSGGSVLGGNSRPRSNRSGSVLGGTNPRQPRNRRGKGGGGKFGR